MSSPITAAASPLAEGATLGHATGNPIEGNAIYSNTGLGINLVGGTEDANGVTANDTGDADTGPNNLQNFPVITTAIISGNQAVISGTLNSVASSSFAIDVYRNATADASGYGEGQVYVGTSTTVTTDANGNGSFSVTDANYPSGSSAQYYTATATLLTTTTPVTPVETSEFSLAVKASAFPIYIVTNTSATGAGSLRDAIVFANANPGTTIQFNIPGSGTQTITPTAANPLPSITAANTTVDGYSAAGGERQHFSDGQQRGFEKLSSMAPARRRAWSSAMSRIVSFRVWWLITPRRASTF